ncbi:glycosyl transferase family 1 [Zunongwangia profunda]|uniref:Glycosyl transferase, group 1 n=2 Tax=Zunongwangia profunda TaxID=398743 RepID=D5BCZ2_ZUNPS|nr:glycosyl transferase family 1 [Zunongwangia profunda]ADF52672.1 glycosyl transferase, group 1 [Zunongwangia profunda SM-A87]MAS71405.1 glycosyl transferase family 1 [Zunongwangia sp.]HAJ82880.1 glycosyl transferase family 1 [Zunongwangia profunda]HCV81413.1 glycosyl transferase family 1 [Zunongwangia profunda]
MKKVLIITYYWPPAGGPGVQRWLKFVKYLRDFEVEPVVYIPENPNYPLIDKSFINEVPKDIEVIRQPIFEPYKLAAVLSKKNTKTISSGIIKQKEKQNFIQKLMLFIRGNFFIPDARKFWIQPSVKFLKSYLEKTNIDTIITTGPPHSLHLIGLGLKRQLHLRWIADFRDPWTQIGYQKQLKLTKYSAKKHQSLEKQVLNTADQIITTSFTTKKEFALKTTKPIEVITNGFDSELNTESKLDEIFSISHIGSLLSGRNPELLWKVLAEISKENENFRRDFKLKLYGAVSDDVVQSIKNAGLENELIFGGYISHKEAIAVQKKSQLLLLIEIDSEETKGIIAGKLFEYLASKRPILAIGPRAWDVAKIIEETHSGKSFLYNQEVALKEYILNSYQRYRENKLLPDSKNIEDYHRKNLTKQLAKLIEK